MFKSKTPEQKAAGEAERQLRAQEQDVQRQRDQAARERAAYLSTPVGQAEVTSDRGDEVFQYSLSVMSQQAIIVAIAGSKNIKIYD